MAMPGGGYGGYGGPDDHYHQDANGGHGGVGHHALSSSNGVGVGGGVSGMEHEHEQDDAEEIRRLHARITEVDIECERHHKAAKQTQTLLETRAIARLATEMEVKELTQQHEEKLKIYREKEREINDACVIGDNRIKELQERQRKTEEDMRDARRKLREMIDLAKEQERKAIINEEGRRRAAAIDGGGGTNGGTASPGAGAAAAASLGGKGANGVSMGRRTQSSTGAPFAPRRASTGTGAEDGARPPPATERGRRPQGKPGSSGAQPKPFDQMRQKFLEDTMTDFFGL